MKPPFLEAIDFKENDLTQDDILLELRIHVVEECNLKCLYCLSNAPLIGEAETDKRKLTLNELKKVIREAKELGARVVSITGSGEPLLYKHLKKLINYVISLELRVVLFTNGLLLTPLFAKFLYNNNVNLMLKLNSFNPDVNDKLVGVVGAQKIFLQKIKMLVEMGFANKNQLALNCIICKDNYDEIPELFIFCRKQGIIPWIETLTITGRAKPHMLVSLDRITRLYKKIAEIDKKQFGFKWEPDSPIIGADRRRYRYVCQVDLYGNVYHTDANMTDEIGSIMDKTLNELISSNEFKKLRDKDKHSCTFIGINVDELSQRVYNVLKSRRFRAGSSPSNNSKELVLQKIRLKMQKNLPIELFQFWGGCKNPNLGVNIADLCEQATLDNLSKLNVEIKSIYQPGLKIYISPGDSRVERVNLISHEKTKAYVESLTKMTKQYNGLFTVIPVSTLYKKYSKVFEKKLKEVREKSSKDIENHHGFEKLVVNAEKNIFIKGTRETSINAARDYVIYRVSEEEAQIFKEFKDCIRTFFIRYIPFYKQYIKAVSQTIPHLDCSLVFFTGKKGNITQPWQAISKEYDGKIEFLSQERLKR